MKAEIVDGKVTLDIAETLASLSTKQRIEIALNLAVTADVFASVVDQLIEGFSDPLNHGFWIVEHSTLNVQRARLLTAQDRVFAEYVKASSRDLDYAKKCEAREKCRADALEAALDAENARRRECDLPRLLIPSLPEWRYGESLPQAEIDAIVAEVRAKMTGAKPEKVSKA